jgi:hypothetical protein
VEGVQAILAEALHDPFVRDFPGHRLHLSQVVPEKLFRQLEAEEVSEMHFIRHRAPRDITTAIGRKATIQTSGTMNLAVKFKDRMSMEAVRRFYENHRGTESVLEFDDGDTRFPFEQLKVKIKFRGKERTMDLGDPTKMRGSVDVTDQMKWSESGHPTFSSIAKAAKDLLLDLKNEPPRASR